MGNRVRCGRFSRIAADGDKRRRIVACTSGSVRRNPYWVQRTTGPVPCGTESPMSTLKDRAAARVVLVPEAAAPGYAAAMAQLPRVRIAQRRPIADRALPAVGSFN